MPGSKNTESFLISHELINRESQTNLLKRPESRTTSGRKICPPAPASSDIDLLTSTRKQQEPEDISIKRNAFESEEREESNSYVDTEKCTTPRTEHGDDECSIFSEDGSSSFSVKDVCSLTSLRSQSDSEDSDYEVISEAVRTKWPEGVPVCPKSYRTMVNVALVDPKNFGGMKFHEICKYLRENFQAPEDHIVEKKAREAITTMMNENKVASIRKIGIIEPLYVTQADKIAMEGESKPKRFIVPEMRMLPPPGALKPQSHSELSQGKGDIGANTSKTSHDIKDQQSPSLPSQELLAPEPVKELKPDEIDVNNFKWDAIPQGHHPNSTLYENPSGFRMVGSTLDMQIRPLQSLPLNPKTTLDGITTPHPSYLPNLPTVNFTISQSDKRHTIVEDDIYSLDPVYLDQIERRRDMEDARNWMNDSHNETIPEARQTVGERFGIENRNHMSRINDPSFVDMSRQLEPEIYRQYLISLNRRPSDPLTRPVLQNRWKSQKNVDATDLQPKARTYLQFGSKSDANLPLVSTNVRSGREYQSNQGTVDFETPYYGDAEEEDIIEECWTRLYQRGKLRQVDLEIKHSLSERFKNKRVQRDTTVTKRTAQESHSLNGLTAGAGLDPSSNTNRRLSMGLATQNPAQAYQSSLRNYLADQISNSFRQTRVLSTPRHSSSNVPRPITSSSSARNVHPEHYTARQYNRLPSARQHLHLNTPYNNYL